jgi:hypothetical protein
MRNLRICAEALLCLTFIFLLFSGCKKHDKEEPLVITPTVNPIPLSVLVYLITPSDKTFNPDYYRAAKTAILSLQGYYKTQLGTKTFVLNPVVVDTFTAQHNSTWFNSNNGDSISHSGPYGYFNTKFELQQYLGSKFDTTMYTYFAYVQADFGDETIPRGLAAEGMSNLVGLASKYPDGSTGADGHALGHAFGLPEPATQTANGIMSLGYPSYPNCVFTQAEKDTLNLSPFLQTQ